MAYNRNFDPRKIKLVAFDLDGTLTQHKTSLEPANRAVLERLSSKYKLLMVGAGACMRIFNQLCRFPVDIIGNYGLQYAEYDEDKKDLSVISEQTFICDRESVEKRVSELRAKYGFLNYYGKNTEYHASGCVTIPLLGTDAPLDKKLEFDPTREKRRKIYAEICRLFPDYKVFIGGSSSFDMAPFPYDKYYALSKYCAGHGLEHENAVYVGDDYGPGGNDESVFNSDIPFICVDNYLDLEKNLSILF